MNNKKQYETVEEYKTKFYIKYPKSSLEIIEFQENNTVVIKDQYGYCLYDKHYLLNSGISSIRNAVNKTEYFINQAKKFHDNKYDYSETIYVGEKTKIKIICPIHGKFEQNPSDHKMGKLCMKCGFIKKGTSKKNTHNKLFIDKANEIHNFKYDYSLVEFTNSKEKVKIICKEHGIFEQSTSAHLQKYGCPACSLMKRSLKLTLSKEEFIEKANLKHNNKYDYNETDYKISSKKIKIICFDHGEFYQRAAHHLAGHGCQKCKNEFLSKNIIDKPTGWGYRDWEKKANYSKNFDSFKVYIIKCWNDEEEFYKIGKTFLKIKDRFHSTHMPYKYEIIKIFEGTSLEISIKENELQKQNKEHKYLPKLKFSGSSECFSFIE